MSKGPIDKELAAFSIGGYTFKAADGREFVIDWSTYEADVAKDVDGYLVATIKLSNFDDGFSEYNKEVKIGEICADFITDCEILDVAYEAYIDPKEEEFVEMVLVDFVLTDEGGKPYSFSLEAIDAYNCRSGLGPREVVNNAVSD